MFRYFHDSLEGSTRLYNYISASAKRSNHINTSTRALANLPLSLHQLCIATGGEGDSFIVCCAARGNWAVLLGRGKIDEAVG